MFRVVKAVLGVSVLSLSLAASAQVIDAGARQARAGSTDGGVVITGQCPEAGQYLIEVPNLICRPQGVVDPFDGQAKTAFRPEVINLDDLTIREVLEAAGAQIDCEGFELLVQAVCVQKDTPYWKCTAFVSGPGSGANTNFNTGWKYADSTMLDDSVVWIAFGGKLLGDRCLLFSPPLTKYKLKVIYVRRDLATGRVGAPVTAFYEVQRTVPSRADIACNIEYFGTVAAGVTQKCKITEDVAAALNDCLSIPDNLEALICFETVVALFAIDFSVLRDMRNTAGQYDARFFTSYLIDSDEEPIGCLLIEMANAALWF